MQFGMFSAYIEWIGRTEEIQINAHNNDVLKLYTTLEIIKLKYDAMFQTCFYLKTSQLFASSTKHTHQHTLVTHQVHST